MYSELFTFQMPKATAGYLSAIIKHMVKTPGIQCTRYRSPMFPAKHIVFAPRTSYLVSHRELSLHGNKNQCWTDLVYYLIVYVLQLSLAIPVKTPIKARSQGTVFSKREGSNSAQSR
jgi:hypothetical protein